MTKSNGGLVLKLHDWDAKVAVSPRPAAVDLFLAVSVEVLLTPWLEQIMLHSNGRGDMWWSTHDVSKMTEAYNALREALFPADQASQGPA